ncbi:hypothetical protein B0H14DRAFT_2625501 [Mycena olivaceomarginata]|nr:hypothetical protein B0H14DRAFT_2625501 [Mycena olivaceomarginata]
MKHSPTEGYLYFAAAGSNCRGYIVLPNRLSSFQELAAEFSAQGRDPALAQLVWGHGRAIRQPGTCLQSSFFVVAEWVSLTIYEAVRTLSNPTENFDRHVLLEGGGELVYDLVQPYPGRLSLYHQLKLTRHYNLIHRPADFKNLVIFLRPLNHFYADDLESSERRDARVYVCCTCRPPPTASKVAKTRISGTPPGSFNKPSCGIADC